MFTQTSTGPVRTPATEDSVEGCAEGVGAVGLFPGEALAPEVAVRGGLLVDRPAQVEVLDDGGGPEVEHLPDHVPEPLRVGVSRPERLQRERDGMGLPDGVGNLEL